MEKYEMFANGDHLFLKEKVSLKKRKIYSGINAVKVFNSIVEDKLNGKLDIETCENGVDKRISKNNIEITMYNFDELMKVVQKIDEKEKTKKGLVLGGTTIATGSLILAMLAGNNGGHVQAATTGFDSEPIRVEQDVNMEMEVAPETTTTILDAELFNDGMVYASVDDYEYTGETYTSSASLDTVYIHTYSNYNDELERNVSRLDNIVDTVSNRWGVSNDLIRDIMKQESHGGTLDNKMQIVFSSWHDQIIKVYNFETNRYETMVLTNTPEKYHNVTYVITREQLSASAETNINAGGIILAYLYNRFDYDLLKTIQAYNFGEGATKEVITYTAEQLGMTLEEYKNSGQNDEFMKYTAIVRPHYGDPNYLYHVAGKSTNDFNLDDGKEYLMRYLDEAGNVVERATLIRSAYTLDLEATVGAGSNLHM